MRLTIRYINRLLFLAVVAMLTLTIVACGEDEEDTPDVVLPSGLTISVVEDTTTYGLVTVRANAANANFYTIIFYDKNKTESIEEPSGVAAYQFTTSGTYQITVRAHATAADYVEESRSVTLNFGQPGNNGNPPTSGFTSPMSYQNYTLVWNDEFDGASLNSQDWNYEIGTGNNGWGNNELQYYRQENTTVSNGILAIEAKRQFFNGSQFTSSRITTQGKQSFQHGRIDIRAAMPYGQGMWPALWMLGESISNVGWPRCGEIDIMEMVGGSVQDGGDDVCHGTAHWADASGARALFGGKTTLANGTLADEWHVYSIVWDNQKIRWLFDNVQYHELNVSDPELSELRNQNFFFIMNVAVGGDWPGSPNSSTVFPQKMFVDYVRVFQ